MKKDKITQKKPTDSIKQKTPAKYHIPSVSEKIPNDSGDNFALPPRKISQHEKIPKAVVKVPSNHGSQKIRQKDVSPLNTPPKRDYSSYKNVQTKQPTDQGKTIQKIKIQSKTPERSPQKEQVIPSRKGLDESKKSRKSINKPLAKQIRTKKPRKTSLRSPPATYQLEKKKLDRQSNQSPPPKIVQKTPNKKKPLPPTAISSKIPKTKIKEKRPN
ncbi:MAG: hypothetical protein ACXAC6_15060 [Candidatus Hodarchaeales archaeon]